MRYRILLSMAAWFAVGVSGIAKGQDGRVGPLGEPSRLAVRSVKCVPPHEVAKALFDDIDVAYASFFDAPLDEFKRLLVEKAVVGFQHSGFPTPQVTIADRLDHLELTVDEGPRWAAGEIRVNGTKEVDARRIIEGLIPDRAARASASTQSTSRWPVGQPAPLDEPARQGLSRRVEELLAQQGYINAQWTVQVVGDQARRTAALIVIVRNEGEPARVRDIELAGNKIHTREQIFAWLRLPPDAVFSTELCEDIERRLKASGRFTNCAFAPAARGRKPQLRVDECAFATRLDQPLSREDQALLKLAEWVDNFESQGEDLVVKSDTRDEWIELVLSPRRAFAVLFKLIYPSSKPDRFDAAIVCSQDEVSMSSVGQGRKFTIDCVAEAFFPRANFTLVDHVNGASGFNFWWNSKPQTKGPSAIGPRLTACAALSLLRKQLARCSWDGPILTAEWKSRRLRLDSRDGRLVELHDTARKLRLFPRRANAGIGEWITEPAVGQFGKRCKEIAAASAGFINVADSHRLFSSAVEFVCREHLEQHLISDKGGKKLTAAIVGLSQRGAFQAIDDLFFINAHSEPQPFLIPSTIRPADDDANFRIDHKGLRFMVMRLPLNWADDFFARNSRPWLVWREAAFITNGKVAQMRERLRLFPDAKSGPVTTLALAEAMLLAGMKDEAADFARQGLQQVTLDAFRRDYADFLVPNGKIPSYLLGAAAAIRSLGEAEIDALSKTLLGWGWIGKAHKPHLSRIINELRADANRPTPAALSAALDALWQSTLEQAVKQRLEAIGTTEAPPNDQQQTGRRGLLFR